MKFTIDKAVILIGAAVLLVWAGPTAAAQDAAQEAAAQDAPVCSSDESALRSVERMVENWKNNDPAARALEQRGVSLIDGQAQIYVQIDKADWGKARSLAYTRAYLAAMGSFVRQSSQEITSETVQKSLEDLTSNSFEAGEDAATFLERIDRKASVLAEMHLDQALKEAGMSDEEIARLSGAEKIPMYRDSLERPSTSRALGRVAGLVPYKTFEAIDCEGNSWVAVVAAFSTRMRALAEQIDNGEPIRPDPDRAGVSPRDRINTLSDEDLVEQFGVRRWWDQDGYPVLIAFGQWGWSPKAPTNAERDRRYQFARKQAEIQATNYLAEFIQVSAEFTRPSSIGEIFERAVVVGDGLPEDVENTAIMDRIVGEARTKSTVQLTGLGILRTWSSQHPVVKHQELTGAIAYWSPARENQVRASLGLDAKHPEPEPAPEETPEPEPEPQPTASGTVQSKDLMDASDF